MKDSQIEKQIDKDGYIEIPKEFQEHGYTIKFVEDLGNNWRIYSRHKTNGTGFTKYELVKIRKQESFTIAGNVIPKKYKYPSTNDFGFYGWEVGSVEYARKKHREIVDNKQDKIDAIDNKEVKPEINYPKGEFTLKELCVLNPKWKREQLSKEVNHNKLIICNGTRNSGRGKPARVYKRI